MLPLPAVVVNQRAELRARRGHPWIFRSDVARARDIEPGALVRVIGPQGRLLGTALYSTLSEISLRLLSFGEGELPADWLRRRLQAAVAWRERLDSAARVQRLVHGEGDLLPGLVVDRYGDFLVLQTLTQGSERLAPEIVSILVERLQPRGILERNDPRVRRLEGLEPRVSLLHGEVPPLVELVDDGLTIEADLWKGQKTGLFLDQRENYQAARRYARGRALDAFSYHGGFALAVAPQCDSVLAIEASEEALARLTHNAARNAFTHIAARRGNAFDVLRELDEARERFDTVILDPPAFAKSRSAVERAWRGYKEINLRALRLLAPGGVLITCSCSYHVHENDFETIVQDAAADAGVAVAVVEKRRQARDHPALLGLPESYYLKCLVLRRLT